MESETRVDAEDLVRRTVDSVNRRDFHAFTESFDPDLVSEDPLVGQTKGRETFLKAVENSLKAAPDAQDKIVSIVSKGDTLAVEFITVGTFTGSLELKGHTIPPTGRRFEFRSAVFYRINSKGVIAERRWYFDSANLLQQLGLKV
jgi:predicted ester cyclase